MWEAGAYLSGGKPFTSRKPRSGKPLGCTQSVFQSWPQYAHFLRHSSANSIIYQPYVPRSLVVDLQKYHNTLNDEITRLLLYSLTMIHSFQTKDEISVAEGLDENVKSGILYICLPAHLTCCRETVLKTSSVTVSHFADLMF